MSTSTKLNRKIVAHGEYPNVVTVLFTKEGERPARYGGVISKLFSHHFGIFANALVDDSFNRLNFFFLERINMRKIEA